MPQQVTMQEARDKMDKCVDAYRQELANIRTGRAHAGLLDSVEVEVYGSRMKINQVGNVTVPDAHMLAIDLWDKSQIGAVEKALRASQLGVNPSNDGRLIRIPIPPLTEDRRKQLVKHAAHLAEEAKVAVRNVRRHAVEAIKVHQKDGDIPEDDAHRLTDEIQKLTDKHTAAIDAALKTKEADIMEV